MSNFTGTWTDELKETITVTGDWQVLALKISTHPQDSYQAFYEGDKVTANFRYDKGVLTGTLSGNEIIWSNNTKWTKS